jgi:hypothetical protein
MKLRIKPMIFWEKNCLFFLQKEIYKKKWKAKKM